VLLGFLLLLGAAGAGSSVRGSGFLLKSGAELGVFKPAFAMSGGRQGVGSCTCCGDDVECRESGVSEVSGGFPEDSVHFYGKATSCCGEVRSAQEIVAGGCGRCPVNRCGGCCGHDFPSLFLSESFSRIEDPGRVPPVQAEDWSAARRTLRPLLQPPRGV
jgi:hypothetical protein